MAKDDLQRGRESARSRRWLEAFEALAAADRTSPLGAGDLELLATSAYLAGHESDYAAALDRAHHAYVANGERRRAVRCAFWLSLQPTPPDFTPAVMTNLGSVVRPFVIENGVRYRVRPPPALRSAGTAWRMPR